MNKTLSLPRTVLILFLFFLVFAALYFAKPFLVPFAFGAIFSMLFYPMCKWLEAKGLGRGFASFLCVLSFVLLIAGLISLLVWQLSGMASEMSGMQEKVTKQIENLQIKLQNSFGVFFIMTVSLNRPKYMTTEQVKQLTDEGHAIESHTWDHHNVKQYKTDQDWVTQIEKPKKKIEEITGKTAEHFAYPFGLWNREAIPELKKRGVRSAYILSTKRDPDDPLYTIRRIIASGYWSAPTMYRSMIQSFD